MPSHSSAWMAQATFTTDHCFFNEYGTNNNYFYNGYGTIDY